MRPNQRRIPHCRVSLGSGPVRQPLIRRRYHRLLSSGVLLLLACAETPTAARSPHRAAAQASAGLVITPVNRGFTVAQGGPSPATAKVTVGATAGTLSGLSVGSIGYGAGQPTGWLTTTALSGTSTPATLTLGITPGTLPVGSYSATVPVSAA